MKHVEENMSATADHKTVPAHIAAIMRKVDGNVSKFTASREVALTPSVEVEGKGFFGKLAQPLVDLLSRF